MYVHVFGIFLARYFSLFLFFCTLLRIKVYIKLGRYWWNLMHSFLNKLAAKIKCKRFPAHLNNVSTLPCETWNSHHASISDVRERNSRIYPTSTVASKFARFESIWLQCLGLLQEHVYKNTSLIWTNWNSDWDGVGQDGSCRHCGSHSSVASLIAPDQWCMFCTHSVAITPTRCYQMSSNLVNLLATVKVGKIMEFLSVTTQW